MAVLLSPGNSQEQETDRVARTRCYRTDGCAMVGGAMRILLLSMPDSFEHTPTIAVRMPNGALASLAGNLDPHHDVAIADLVLAQSSVRQTIERLMDRVRPDLV